MRRFRFQADLRRSQGSAPAARAPEPAPAVARDGLALSQALGSKRRQMRLWPQFQRVLRALPPVEQAADHFADAELADEYVRISNVSSRKVLDAAPGFGVEGKTEIHCFFDDDGSKHLVSRLSARPNARVTELTLYPSGELTRLYYENAGGPEQSLDELYELGLAGLEDDVARFARHPNYHLKFVLLPCQDGCLVEIYKGTCFYDSATGSVRTEEDEAGS